MHEPKFFTGRLEAVSGCPEKLAAAYKADFGEDQQKGIFQYRIIRFYGKQPPVAQKTTCSCFVFAKFNLSFLPLIRMIGYDKDSSEMRPRLGREKIIWKCRLCGGKRENDGNFGNENSGVQKKMRYDAGAVGGIYGGNPAGRQ